MQLVDKLKRIFTGYWHEWFFDLWQLNCGYAGLKNADDLVDGHLQDGIHYEILLSVSFNERWLFLFWFAILVLHLLILPVFFLHDFI